MQKIQIVLQPGFDLDSFIHSGKPHSFLLPINYNLDEVDRFDSESREYLSNLIERLTNKLIDNQLELPQFLEKKPSRKETMDMEKGNHNDVRQIIKRSDSFRNSLTCVDNSQKRFNHNKILQVNKENLGSFVTGLINL